MNKVALVVIKNVDKAAYPLAVLQNNSNVGSEFGVRILEINGYTHLHQVASLVGICV